MALPYLTNVDYAAGTRPALQGDSPSLVSMQDAAAWASDVDAVFQAGLGRNAGAVGHQYWTYDLMQDTGALMEDQGYTFEKAKAMAIGNMAANVARSAEGQAYLQSGNANASPAATGAGTWNPTNNPESLNAKWGGAGSGLVQQDDGSQVFVPARTPSSTRSTHVPLNPQPMQPASIYGGDGGRTVVVSTEGKEAKTAADQFKILPFDKAAIAGENRGDYSRQKRKGRAGTGGGGMGLIPSTVRSGTGGVQIPG